MKSKIVKCIDCGKEFPRKELNRRFRCQDCRIIVVRENIVGLMSHEGPHWVKWHEAMKAALAKL